MRVWNSGITKVISPHAVPCVLVTHTRTNCHRMSVALREEVLELERGYVDRIWMCGVPVERRISFTPHFPPCQMLVTCDSHSMTCAAQGSETLVSGLTYLGCILKVTIVLCFYPIATVLLYFVGCYTCTTRALIPQSRPPPHPTRNFQIPPTQPHRAPTQCATHNPSKNPALQPPALPPPL